MGVRKKTSGLTLGLVGFDVYLGIFRTRTCILKVESELLLSLKASLKSMGTHWFSIKVTALES
jgi:hypothetical protein